VLASCRGRSEDVAAPAPALAAVAGEHVAERPAHLEADGAAETASARHRGPVSHAPVALPLGYCPAVRDGERVRVLVVEDQSMFADALRHLLERDDRICVVGVAHDGVEALDRVVEDEPDVVLMDVSMPLLDGVETTRRVLTLRSAVRVVVLSGTSDADLEARARDAGAAAFLVKGDLAEEVIEAVLAVSREPSA